VHFVEGADGIAEVLERGATDDEIERVVGEWQVGRVPVPEVNRDPFPPSVLGCDADKGG
jgi:hypothetical protein